MYTIEQIQKVFARKGYKWDDAGPFPINIIGVRSNNSLSNSFDDSLYVVYKVASLWNIIRYDITTDPGKPWLLKPMDKGGCAVMVPGQYENVYQVGIHGRSKPESRRYEALEQVGNIAYVRDNSKDAKINTELYSNPANIFRAILKTNIHRASQWSLTRAVETYSAGCQVFADPAKFLHFMGLCRQARASHSNRFTYTLLEEKDFSV